MLCPLFCLLWGFWESHCHSICGFFLFSRFYLCLYFPEVWIWCILVDLSLVSPCLGFTQLLDFLHPCVFIKFGKFSAFLSLSLFFCFFFFWGFTQSFYITVKGGYIQVVLPFLILLACNADVVVGAAAIKLCPWGKDKRMAEKSILTLMACWTNTNSFFGLVAEENTSPPF